MSYVTEMFLGSKVLMHALSPGTFYMCMFILHASIASIVGGISTANKLDTSRQD